MVAAVVVQIRIGRGEGAVVRAVAAMLLTGPNVKGISDCEAEFRSFIIVKC